jgi:DUF1365 family protein
MNRPVVSWLAPALCVGDVMHARTRPTRNVFHYPIFYLRLPLSQLATLNVPGLAVNKPGICQILNRDHGPRDGTDLMIWVRSLLNSHGLSQITAEGEIVLQTMPRLLGYLFNPVSFYFCHDRAGQLRAVVCEVSNTFGERHNYLVNHPDHRPIEPHDVITAQKVFHVSPFFPLHGTYEFRFGGKPETPLAMINYIAESSNDASTGQGQYGLRTWVRGKSVSLDSAALRNAMFQFPLLTLGVIARIHWQALRLWIKKVTFFSKPLAPLKETTS